MSIYKCLLVGDGGTGKTSLIKRLITGEFSTLYSATAGYEVQHLTVSSKDSAIKLSLDVWDVSGQTSSGHLLEEILKGADCAIIVFDVTSRITFNNVAIWYREIVHTCGQNIPVVVVGNKIDMPARKVKTETMLKKFSNGIKYYDVSVKTNFNIEQPILWIAAQLLEKSENHIIDKSLQPVIEELTVSSEKLRRKKKSTSKEVVPLPLPAATNDSNLETNVEPKSTYPSRLRARRGANVPTATGISKDHNKSSERGNAKQGKKKSK